MRALPFAHRIIFLGLPVLVSSAQAHPRALASAEAWTLKDAYLETRLLLAEGRSDRAARRDAVLSAWISAPELGSPRVIVLCPAGTCSPDVEEPVLDGLASAFQRMPSFLMAARVKQVRWYRRSSGDRPDGMGKDGVLTIFATPDAPIDQILVHELAHILFERAADLVAPFLALRFRTPAMRLKMAELIAYLERTGQTSCGPERSQCLDEHARALMAEAKVPQRYPDDLHAVPSDTGYWASAVELAFRTWRGEGEHYLLNNFDKEEISWLLSTLGPYPPPVDATGAGI